MKIHYNNDFDCYMVAECHKTDIIELDRVKLIPIEELEKIKAEIKEEEEKGIYYECEEWIEGRPCDEDYFYGLLRAIMIIDKHISKLKGE